VSITLRAYKDADVEYGRTKIRTVQRYEAGKILKHAFGQIDRCAVSRYSAASDGVVYSLKRY
jgi:hypothetical protein